MRRARTIGRRDRARASLGAHGARFAPALARGLALIVALLFAGCVTGVREGDRLFLAGDLIQAEAAYRSYLADASATGPGTARARYRLALIYAMPGSALHDWEKADRTLRAVVDRDPGTPWARQAELLLSLHAERARLERELEAQSEKVSALLAEVVKLTQAAREADGAVEDRDARVEQLSGEIAELRKSIGRLGERLAAREQELERIKKIDLQTPP